MNNFEQKTPELGLNCVVLISDFHYFSNLNPYIELIKKFLKYKINLEKFETDFILILSSVVYSNN